MLERQTRAEPNVGGRVVQVEDAAQGARIPLLLLYPTRAPERAERFGPYELLIARDAAAEGEGLPLVVVSHGTGGSPLVHRDLAAHLSRAGFVVALLEHPGNSRSDDRLAGTVANLENRPRHVRLVIDAAFADPVVGARLSGGGVGVIGQSIGGYTALAVAGGRPTASPNETPDGLPRPVAVTPDPRVRALVLLTPAAGWFLLDDSALSGVEAPILMRTGEKDEYTSAPHAEIILRGARDRGRVEHRVVPGAGHFSFHSPFPPSMTSPSFPPSQDPAGFDRAAYQPVLHAEVGAFLQRLRLPPGAAALL